MLLTPWRQGHNQHLGRIEHPLHLEFHELVFALAQGFGREHAFLFNQRMQLVRQWHLADMASDTDALQFFVSQQFHHYFRQNQFVIELRGYEFYVCVEAGAHRFDELIGIELIRVLSGDAQAVRVN